MSARRVRETKKKRHAVQGQFGVFPSYRGGPTTTYNGYVWEYVGGHRLANMWGFAPQHRLVGEDLVGRPLRKGEVVHHHDEVRTNNAPANLQVMTGAAHRAHHNSTHGAKMQIPLPRAEVIAALDLTGGIKPASRMLGCSHSTLRLRFPDLCRPYQRTRPTRILSDVPSDVVKLILKAARDPLVGIHEVSRARKMSTTTILRLCAQHEVQWVKKKRSDAGVHRPTPWQ